MDLVELTKGLGIRNIRACLRSSQIIANDKTYGVLTKDILEFVVKKIKKNKLQEEANNARELSIWEKAFYGSATAGAITGIVVGISTIIKNYYQIIKDNAPKVVEKAVEIAVKTAQPGIQIVSNL